MGGQTECRLTKVVGNMKVITSIYLNCRPELRDEWLSGSDQELEPEDSHVSVFQISSTCLTGSRKRWR